MALGPPIAAAHKSELPALLLLFVVPAMFVTNPVVSKAFIDTIPAWQMSLWRWLGAALIVAPFAARGFWRNRAAFAREWLDLLILGFLGLIMCGAVVYVAAGTTTASNIALIFSSPPIFIVVLGRLFFGQRMSKLQGAGVGVSFLGVIAILSKGDPAILAAARFTPGDLWILAASVCWAVYSLRLRSRPSAFGTLPRFFAIMLAGIPLLVPGAVWEIATIGGFTPTLPAIGAIAWLALVPAAGAYACYNYVTGRLGAARTGVMLYLTPIYGALLAWSILGERLQWFHYGGAILVLAGLYLTSRRK